MREPYFRRTAEDPRLWFSAAEDLLQTARLVWETKHAPVIKASEADLAPRLHEAIRHMRGFYLLAGAGIESFLKGLRVAQMVKAGESPVVADRRGCRLAKTLAHHRLLNHATAAGLGLSHNQSELLKKLEMAVI